MPFPSITQTIRTAIAVLVNAAAALSIQGELLEDVEKRLSFAAFEGRLRLKTQWHLGFGGVQRRQACTSARLYQK